MLLTAPRFLTTTRPALTKQSGDDR
ncbi:hypothetical protein FMEAI12_3140004 [Parafrankia sp. Ea1.12]|nr:hypothetical protein FMEAI12_3140004 [Parafrankia sp. Ea1.12]